MSICCNEIRIDSRIVQDSNLQQGSENDLSAEFNRLLMNLQAQLSQQMDAQQQQLKQHVKEAIWQAQTKKGF